MSSFSTGMQMGLTAMQMANENRLKQAELDMAQAREARAAEEFGWRRDKETEQKAARESYAATTSGLQPTQRTQIQDTYGMTPAQVNQQLASGGITGLQSKLASYDAPDSYDLQNVPEAPAAGVQPRFTADQVKAGPVNRMDREQALARMALAGLDTTSLRQSHAAQDDLVKSEIASKVMNLKTADLEKMAPDINMSGYPMLYTGKSKNGYTFLATEPDGKTPIPGSTFTMNEAQLRQLAMSHELGNAGFGTEALDTLKAAHKDIGDHVAKWNETQTKLATTNNQAQYYGDHNAAEMMKARAISAHYNRPQAANMREFQDSKGNSVMVDITGLKPNKDGTIPLPAGLKPKTARPEMSMSDVTARAKAYVESGMADPDNPKTPLTMQKAVQIVQAEAGGQPYKSAADRIIEELAAQEKGGAGANPGGAPAGGAQPTYNQQLQQAYHRWQGLKAPWYMPTPANNFEERQAEAAYEALLRSPR